MLFLFFSFLLCNRKEILAPKFGIPDMYACWCPWFGLMCQAGLYLSFEGVRGRFVACQDLLLGDLCHPLCQSAAFCFALSSFLCLKVLLELEVTRSKLLNCFSFYVFYFILNCQDLVQSLACMYGLRIFSDSIVWRILKQICLIRAGTIHYCI